MGIKCVLVYKLPKGVPLTREDGDRIISALTNKLYCVPEAALRAPPNRDAPAPGGSGSGASATMAERQYEATVTRMMQLRAADPSVVASPRSLQDLWLFKLHREAPHRLFVMARGKDEITRVNEAEPSVRTFLEKRLEYRQRGTATIVSQSFMMGGDRSSDVTVKLLQVMYQSPAPKALALELIYHPAPELGPAEPLLRELAQHVIDCVGAPTGVGPGQAGMLHLLEPKYINEHKRGQYGPLHTVEAYYELLRPNAE